MLAIVPNAQKVRYSRLQGSIVEVTVEVGNRRIGEEEEGKTFMRQRLKGYVLYVLYSCL